jgi:hypothetical protein
MITAQVETAKDALPELMQLFPLHWKKLALQQDKVPLQPEYTKYLQMENEGKLLLVTLRAEGRLVGYWVSFLGPELHYSSCLAAKMDIWFIHPDCAKGRAVVTLGKAVEKELRRRGVLRWYAGEKLHSPCGKLYTMLGMEPVETYYLKWIGD